MWRRVFVSGFLKQSVSAAAAVGKHSSPTPSPFPFLGLRPFECSSSSSSSIDFSLRPPLLLWRFTNTHPFSSPSSDKEKDDELKASIQSKPPIIQGLGADNITSGEAKKMMRLVNVEALKMKLGMEEKEVIGYKELLEACESMGVARTEDEAIAFARVLDEAGVVLLFRDKVYLHPDKVVDLVKRAMPIALTPEDDPVRDELKLLLERKEEIDVLAHKQVRRILYFGLGLSILQIGLFFRLTFWEFSWDVMEPIAFFTTTAGIIVGYGYFLFTARDPTYQDLMKRLFISRQRKLFKKHNFDVNRFKELQAKLKNPLDARASIKNRFGLDLEIEDALHRD